MDLAHRTEPHIGVPALLGGGLDAQIAAAEQAVIARDLRIQRNARVIAVRLRDNWPVTLGVTLAATFLLGRALSPRWHEGRAAAAARRAIGPNAPLWRLLPLLWPLLPKDLRARVPSGTIALLSNVAATLTGGLRRKA